MSFKKPLLLAIVLSLLVVLVVACQPATPVPPRVETVEVTRQVEVTRIVEVTVEVTPPPTEAPVYAQETALQVIPLAGPLADRHAEISSMAWYGDYLILVPQYPNFFVEEGDGAVFALPRADIAAYLNGERFAPLEPVQIPFYAPEAYTIDGFEGFEAIVFQGDTAYMTIEVSGADGMYAYLVSGSMSPDLTGLTLDTTNMAEIPTQSGVDNMSEETLFLAGDTLVTIHEANGRAVNPQPVAHAFNLDLSPAGLLPMPNVEYRITDATALDENDRFWVINYFWPGEEVLKPESDPIFTAFGKGPTHAASAGVERLVEMQYSADGLTLTETAPIQLQLLADGSLRNLEAIARFEGGFLVATDKYPTTIFGFVPLPPAEE